MMAVTYPLCLFMACVSKGIILVAGCGEYNMQYCSNCKAVSSFCTNDVGVQLRDLCEFMCLGEPLCNLGEYDPTILACWHHSCSQIEEDVTAAGYFTLRKVCQISDCLNFTLTTLHGHIGTCQILETHTDVASVVYCSMMCLDTDSCRGSTFYGSGECLLHDCGNSTLGTNDTTFIQRSCVGDASHMTSSPTPTLRKVTTKHSGPRILTSEISSAAHTLTVETFTNIVPASIVDPGSAMTTFVDMTLTTTPAYLSYTFTQSASTVVVTKSTNNANNFLDKPSNVVALTSAGGIIVGAAVGMGIATKCQKQVTHS